jgi:hypothetical protein
MINAVGDDTGMGIDVSSIPVDPLKDTETTLPELRTLAGDEERILPDRRDAASEAPTTSSALVTIPVPKATQG